MNIKFVRTVSILLSLKFCTFMYACNVYGLDGVAVTVNVLIMPQIRAQVQGICYETLPDISLANSLTLLGIFI